MALRPVKKARKRSVKGKTKARQFRTADGLISIPDMGWTNAEWQLIEDALKRARWTT